MTAEVIELRKQVQNLLEQINDVIKQNVVLVRELNALTDENSSFNSDVNKAAEHFHRIMSELNLNPETGQNQE